MKRLAVGLALLAAGCGNVDPPPPLADPKLDLVSFFTGKSEGFGEIDVVTKKPIRLRVTSNGRAAGQGRLVLDQRLVEGAKPARMRRWRMRCDDRGRCDGTLTDAVGPVRVDVAGNRAHVRYHMKGGLAVDQWLTLQPDRRTIANRLSVTKWGVTVATVDETIRKLS